MKNKKTSYFMLPIVLAIWGMIGWKIYAAFGGNEKKIVASSIAIVKSNNEEVVDTIKLIANYRDPFLDKMIDNSVSKKVKTNQISQDSKVSVVVESSVWPKLSYHGLVKKSTGVKSVGFLSVNGKVFFVQGNENIGIVSIGKLWKDSVEIFFGKEKRIARK